MEEFLYKKDKLKGKRVLLRVDLNVEFIDGQIVSDFRIKKVIPTIKDLTDAGARVILLAHLGDTGTETLEPVAKLLLPSFPRLFFVQDIFSDDARSKADQMNDGDVILFENLRLWPGEKSNDESFAKHLASFGDVFVNDAFSVCHRNHASIVGIPQFLPSFAGLLLIEEVKHLRELNDPHKPFMVVLGGAKFDTKIPLLQKFLDLADLVFVGGAIANDFFKAKGYFVGDSLVSEHLPDLTLMVNSTKLVLPVDVITTHKGEQSIKSPHTVGVGERILDVGPKTLKMMKHMLDDSQTILWNGPLGKVESGFGGATEDFAKMVSKAHITSVIGGGDVVASIEKLNLFDKFTFVSSGGGAMLDFLLNGTLPGIDALKHQKHEVINQPSTKKPLGWFSSLFR